MLEQIGIEQSNDEKLQLIQQEVEQFGAPRTQIVHDLSSADWALGKLRDLEREQAKEDALVKEKVQMYQEWLEKRNKSREDFRGLLEHDLTAYTATERAKDKKFKLDTPNGKVSYRHSKAAPTWANEKETIAWLEKQDDEQLKEIALNYTPKLDKTALKKVIQLTTDKAVTENGEVIPGIGVNPEHDTILIKPTPIKKEATDDEAL